MQIIRRVEEMKAILKDNKETIGFVPTMGYLHEGHLSLIKESVKQNTFTVVSVFVNPLQFGPNEDFDTYPRDQEKDAKLAKEHGVDYLFMPEVSSMYPEPLGYDITVKQGADVLCGRSRPGHFDGVVTVLLKLFNIVRPTRAYFGMKDAQQLAIVDNFSNQFNLPVEIIGLPTVRAEDGLALSSRNVYLSEEEKKEATYLSKALFNGFKQFQDQHKSGTIIEEVKDTINQNTNGNIDYVEFLEYPSLKGVSSSTQIFVLALAVKFEQARLIDNIIFTKERILNRFERKDD